MSRLTNQVLSKWNVSPSININRESFEVLPYEQITLIKFFNGSSFT